MSESDVTGTTATTILSGDVEVAIKVRGRGSIVLMVHGLGADSTQPQRLLAELSGYRVVTIDLPGHGESRIPAGATLAEHVSFDRYAAHCIDLLEEFGGGAAFVGGISMGASVALSIAARRPDLVAGLLVIRPAWLAAPAQPHLELVSDLGLWVHDEGLDEARTKLQTDERFTQLETDSPNGAAALAGILEQPHVQRSPLVLPTIVSDAPFGDESELQAIQADALLVASPGDALHPVTIADRLNRLLPASTLFIAPPRYQRSWEHGQAVRRRIATFLGERTGLVLRNDHPLPPARGTDPAPQRKPTT